MFKRRAHHLDPATAAQMPGCPRCGSPVVPPRSAFFTPGTRDTVCVNGHPVKLKTVFGDT